MHWELVIAVFTVVVANLSTVLILYTNLDKKIDENRKELSTKIDENRRETIEIIKSIQIEIKEFHGRLCAIEERKK